jgi:hypothetical protein
LSGIPVQIRSRTDWRLIWILGGGGCETIMAQPDYSRAYDEVVQYHERLVDNVTKEILAAADRDDSTDFKLAAILDEYSRNLYDVCTVAGDLAAAKSRGALAGAIRQPNPTEADLPPKKKPLRVATIHCSSDRVTETLDNWFANHLGADPVSVTFTQLDRGHACVVIYKTGSIYKSDSE